MHTFTVHMHSLHSFIHQAIHIIHAHSHTFFCVNVSIPLFYLVFLDFQPFFTFVVYYENWEPISILPYSIYKYIDKLSDNFQTIQNEYIVFHFVCTKIKAKKKEEEEKEGRNGSFSLYAIIKLISILYQMKNLLKGKLEVTRVAQNCINSFS